MNGLNQFTGNGLMQQRNPQFSSYPNSIGMSTAPTNNIIWVQGIEGAKAWQLNPNSIAILLDSEEEGKMYIKVSDNIGISSLRIFNYTEEITTPVPSQKTDIDLSQFVKKDELMVLMKEFLANEPTVSTTNTNTDNNIAGQTEPIYTIAKSAQ